MFSPIVILTSFATDVGEPGVDCNIGATEDDIDCEVNVITSPTEYLLPVSITWNWVIWLDTTKGTNVAPNPEPLELPVIAVAPLPSLKFTVFCAAEAVITWSLNKLSPGLSFA